MYDYCSYVYNGAPIEALVAISEKRFSETKRTERVFKTIHTECRELKSNFFITPEIFNLKAFEIL